MYNYVVNAATVVGEAITLPKWGLSIALVVDATSVAVEDEI